MFRRFTLPLVALFSLAACPLFAAPRPDEKPTGPALIGQAKSFDDLLAMFKATVKNVGGEAIFKSFEKDVFPSLDPKQLPGIDSKKPFGLYGTLADKIEDCRAVLLIPATSEKDFVAMLEDHGAKMTPGKEPGSFDIATPPDFPTTVHLRMHQGYAYVAIGGFDVLDLKKILPPGDVISAKEKAAIFLSLRLDRVPTEAKKMLLGLLRENLDLLKERIPEEELRGIFDSFEKLALRYVKMLLDEGRELAIRIDADTKTGDLFADLTVEANAKSPLAEHFAKRAVNKNAFASLAGDDFVQRIFLTAPLFADEVKEGLAKLIDYGTAEALKELTRGNGSPPEVVSLVESAFKSLKATVQSGEMDLALALRGPNKEGFFTAVGAIHCQETAQLEKAIRAVIPVLGQQEQAMFKFDVGKIGDLKVHEIDLSSANQGPLTIIFGKGQTVYYAFGKNAIYASYGPDGMRLLKEAIEAKPGPAHVFESASDSKKALALLNKVAEARGGGGVESVGWLEMLTSGAHVAVTGGDKLKIRFNLNASGLLMLFGARSSAAGRQPGGVEK